MTITIRKAVPENALALSGLCAAHAAYEKASFNSAGHAERLATLLSDDKIQMVIFIAVIDDSIVGFISITTDMSTWAAQPYLHMDCLFVSEYARGQGIGKALFAAARDYATELGIAEIQWQTPVWNELAIQFYQSLGASNAPKLRFTLNI
jgi:GNAT superfamily N-acetyltransferase